VDAKCYRQLNLMSSTFDFEVALERPLQETLPGALAVR
jgi:hypothetical protein